jgi:predicted acylesterase/phospholipase RssA
MAFHLGCLRALQDRGILPKVKVISTVSGGSVIGASYAYGQGDFAAFDKDMVELLTRGIQGSIIRDAFLSTELPRVLGTLVLTKARAIAKTDAYAVSRRERKKVEMLFAHLKRILRLDRLRLRGPSERKTSSYWPPPPTQNLRKLAKLISLPAPIFAT